MDKCSNMTNVALASVENDCDFTKLHVYDVYVKVGRSCQTTYSTISTACGQTHAVLQSRIVT